MGLRMTAWSIFFPTRQLPFSSSLSPPAQVLLPLSIRLSVISPPLQKGKADIRCWTFKYTHTELLSLVSRLPLMSCMFWRRYLLCVFESHLAGAPCAWCVFGGCLCIVGEEFIFRLFFVVWVGNVCMGEMCVFIKLFVCVFILSWCLLCGHVPM